MTEIFTPFLFAFILAYVLRPFCVWLERRRLPPEAAAVIAMVIGLGVFFGILSLFIGLLKTEIPLFKTQLPIWIETIQTWLGPQLEQFHLHLDWETLKTGATEKITEHINDNADSLFSSAFDTVLQSGNSILGVFANSVVILFAMFYLLIEWDVFFRLVKTLAPLRAQATLQRLALQTDDLLSQYLRGELIVISIMSVFYGVGMILVGIKGGVAIGVFTAIMILVPYIGIALGFSLAFLAAILQFGFDIHIVGVLIVYGLGQLIEGFYLTPQLVGGRIGIHPVALIFALLLFGKLFGFFGVLLALPFSAISLVLIKYSWSCYTQSVWYKK
ncbi:Predicted PurR-regulated permease PerM [Polynucleobacter meluiroseus]|uniref:Predicted PurR-regulated permease PerM n=1 Tax=Polynucleobacter meluiroseus TaxID=1938814 RepID=A0A240DXQ3_9BURK|nr:AI-2E family transporter [Polynucleobacter meluiroseus]SNX27979.1 Predicted PurR-regulated permease PerM [Polynucleobacter meluiroseus]